MQLNMEQKKLIRSTVMGHSMVKGVAGSGKTTVAVHRISFLLNHYCPDTDDRILMVTFNKSLTSYINYIYKTVEEEEQYSLFQADNGSDRVHITNIDKLLYAYFRAYCRESRRKLETVSVQQENVIWQRCLHELSKSYPDVKLLDVKYLGFLKKEVSWIKACNLTDVESYQVVDRIGRTGSRSSGEGPQKLLKNSRTRQAIHALMVSYTKTLCKAGLCDFQDIGLYALQYLKTHRVRRYTHIVIDESQDLSKVQLECLTRLYEKDRSYGSIMFVADTAQSIYDTSWLIKGRSFTSIGLDMTGKSNSLAKNYRTTTQIAKAAYSLIEKDADIVGDANFVKPSLIDKQGEYPVFCRFASLEDELDYVGKLIGGKLLKTYDLKEIAVVARTKRVLEQFKLLVGGRVECTLYSKQEGMDFGENTIKLLTMHSIKGLEFKVVILIGISDQLIPNHQMMQENDDIHYAETMERKLLYVGMTRATEKLYMSCHGEPSRFIRSIRPEYLKLRDGFRIRSLYDIPLKKYKFQDQIQDLCNKEEKIRQWMISELIMTYGYPIDLIGIEYQVQAFSRIGFADIVVYCYKNNQKTPYILIETKQYQSGIKNGVDQLKSYMAVTPQVCYGVVTDGDSLMVFERDGRETGDIPRFDNSMLLTSVRTCRYIDLSRNYKYEFLRDGDSPDEVIVCVDGAQRIYDKTQVVRLPVFADIAAGAPIEMRGEMTGTCTLPRQWINAPSETFMLRVRGNSMINAGIDDRDYVVIHRSGTADNGQIVAVELDGDVTLKRFRSMGSYILLIPENDGYEPMMINGDQVRILGKAVGVLKTVGDGG